MDGIRHKNARCYAGAARSGLVRKDKITLLICAVGNTLFKEVAGTLLSPVCY
jgi:hypothetical protein